MHMTDPFDNHDEPAEGRFSKITALFTVVLGITAIVTNFQTCKALREGRESFEASQRVIQEQADAAKSQAGTAQRQFQALERAWIGIESIDTVAQNIGKIKQKEVPFETTVLLKNYGGSFATDIKLNLAVTSEEKELADAANAICSDSWPTPSSARHIAIFPNKTAPYQVAWAKKKVLTGRPLAFLIGCFLYGDPVTECRNQRTCHWTRFCYRARYDQSNRGKVVHDLWQDYNDAH
jgi:hypothetical protein